MSRDVRDIRAQTFRLFLFFFFSFILLVSACFYPGHPCGTVNVSQGLLATQTVTKWNGRKNEWKTIKEGPRTVGGESRAQVVEEGTGEEEKTEGRPPTGPIKSITFFSLVFRFSVQFFFFRRFSSRICACPRPLSSHPIVSRKFHSRSFIRVRWSLFAFIRVYSRTFTRCQLSQKIASPATFFPLARCNRSRFPFLRCSASRSLHSPLNNCKATALLFLLSVLPRSTKGC